MYATNPTGLTVYGGFEEIAHRMFAYHGTDVPGDAKPLCTVVGPDLVAETGVERLKAKEGKGLITWPSAQYWPADEITTAELLTRQPELQPFIFRLLPPPTATGDEEGGETGFDLVHTWPTNMNKQWRAEYKPTKTNPDESVFHPRRVEQFRYTLRAMMGQDRGDKMSIYFGTRVSVNRNPVYVGTPAAFCKWLCEYVHGSPEWEAAMVSDIRAQEGSGQVTIVRLVEKQDVDGKLLKTKKEFTVSVAEECAFYIKEGYHRMFCVTPMRLFAVDRKLLQCEN